MNDKSSATSAKPSTPSTGVAKNPTIDLAQPNARGALSKQLLADIDAWCADHYDDGHRKHLGASLIGRECSRYLWYTFRWVYHKKFDGRRQRLFQRGHREEPQMVEMLEGIGCTVDPVDVGADMVLYLGAEDDVYHWIERAKYTPSLGRDCTDDRNAYITTLEQGIYPDYPQFRVSACGGHFGGSLDAKIKLPARYGVPEDIVFINEFKTSGTGAGFNNMLNNGVQATKSEHFAQMSYYGWKLGLRYGIYLMANKNDDSLHVEVVKLDWELAQRLEVKAERIIMSPTPPPKISESITYKTCTYCDMVDVCHKAAPYEKNCRSCVNAETRDDKAWYCKYYQNVIPADFIPVGCEVWSPAL